MNFDNYILRAVCTADVESFFDLVNNNRGRLEDFFPVTVAKNKTMEDTARFIPEIITKAENKINMSFLVVDSLTAMPVGYIDIKNIDWNIPKAELGYFIDENYSGKGIMTKALSLIIKHFFDDLNFSKLFLRTHAANSGSRKVAEKNGFRIEGILRNDSKTTKGDIVDMLYYGIIKEDFFC